MKDVFGVDVTKKVQESDAEKRMKRVRAASMVVGGVYPDEITDRGTEYETAARKMRGVQFAGGSNGYIDERHREARR